MGRERRKWMLGCWMLGHRLPPAALGSEGRAAPATPPKAVQISAKTRFHSLGKAQRAAGELGGFQGSPRSQDPWGQMHGRKPLSAVCAPRSSSASPRQSPRGVNDIEQLG